MQQGDIIGRRYQIGARLGNGAMGVVYLGYDQKTGERVAIKTIREEIIDDDNEIPRRFVREGRVLSHLDHPHIVKVIDVNDDAFYIVMEYVNGVTLSYQIHRYEQLPIKPVIKTSYALASALAYIHERGIIHRDIKPSNIMFTKEGAPRLMDFGVAHMKDVTPMTAPGQVLGTLTYVAPEIIYGNPATQSADIWSLGTTMYQMLTGELPFNSKTPAALIADILSQPVPPVIEMRTDTPPMLAGLVDMMLQKEPSQRIDSMVRVKEQLKRLMS